MLRRQIWAIFSSRSESIGWYARSLADMLYVPHLSVHWDYRSSYRYNINDAKQQSVANESLTLALYPEIGQLSKAYLDLIKARNLKAVTLIYDSDIGLIQMRDLLSLSNNSDRRKTKINFIRFQGSGTDRKEVVNDLVQIKKITKSLKRTDKNLILHLKPERLLMFLREARAVGRMTEYDNFLIGSLDIHRLDLTEFETETIANITGLSMLSPAGQPLDLVNEDELMRTNTFRYLGPQVVRPRNVVLTTTEALIYDAITIFAQALFELDRQSPKSVSEPFLECQPLPNSSGRNQWSFGLDIVRQMRNLTNMSGISGPIRFDENGHRVNFTLDVLQLKINGLKKVNFITI